MKKNKTLFIIFAAASALLAIGITVNSAIGIVRPAMRAKGEYRNIFSVEDKIYGAEDNGNLADLTGGQNITLPSLAVFAAADENGVYVVCENRFLYRIVGGEIVASKEMNYRPTALELGGGKVFVGGKMASNNRNRLYCFDALTLGYIDFNPQEQTAQGENESDMAYSERVNALSVDAPVIAINYFGRTVYVATQYGSLYQYSESGETLASRGSEYNFSFADFSDDGTAWVADDNGGAICYDKDLNPSDYVKLAGDIVGIRVLENGAAIADSSGKIVVIDASLKKRLEVNFMFKSSALFTDGMLVALVGTAGETSFYKWSELPRRAFCIWAEAILAVLLAAAIVAMILSGIKSFSPEKYKVVSHTAKVIVKKMYASKTAYLLLLPTVVLAVVFAYYPAANGFILAFYDVEPGGINVFNGLQNFRDLMAKTYFWSGMKNMAIFLVTDIIKGLVPSFVFAELIIAMRSKKAQYATRVLLYLPGIIPGVAMLLIWQSGIFGIDGLINEIVVAFGGKARPWLGQSSTALTSLIFFNFPWVGSYIILYGALMSIPSSFYESAKLDGCSWIKRLFLIDLPMISPQLKYIFVTCFIGSVQDFQRIYMTTEGAYDTSIPMLELYYNLTIFNNYGIAAAMGLILFAILMIATIINLKLKTVESYD